MAVKGQISKQNVMNKMLECFPGSFIYNDGKEIRINCLENGEQVQIKVTLTAAKTPVSNGDDTAIPGAEVQSSAPQVEAVETQTEAPQLSSQEKNDLTALVEALGL